jgi:hypothetical protein
MAIGGFGEDLYGSHGSFVDLHALGNFNDDDVLKEEL